MTLDDSKQTQEKLSLYLEVEALLNELFSEFNYCLKECVLRELKKNNYQPVALCCKDKYYNKYDQDFPAYHALRKEREALYGKPEEIKRDVFVSPCEYHTETGCLLKTHKSPICLAFMCRKSIYSLRDDYGIYEYDYLGFNYALEWLLSGHLTGSALDDFVESCRRMVRQIKEKKMETA